VYPNRASGCATRQRACVEPEPQAPRNIITEPGVG